MAKRYWEHLHCSVSLSESYLVKSVPCAVAFVNGLLFKSWSIFKDYVCFLPVTGALVTVTDLPELLGNLQHNVLQNTKLKCKHQPCVKELSWGIDLEKNFPRSSCHFDYIMAADVVYHHPFLDELLLTFDHLCKNDTVILWAMKFRLDKENQFVDRFQTLFDLEVISNFPSLNITLYKAMRKGRMKARPSKPMVWKRDTGRWKSQLFCSLFSFLIISMLVAANSCMNDNFRDS